MNRVRLLAMLAMVLGISFGTAQDGGVTQTGPKLIPGPFESFNVNLSAAGRPHCLVCKFRLNPAVLIFAKEPAEGKDKVFTELLTKLDEMATEFADRTLCIGVVILSPDARDSTNNAAAEKADEIIKEAVAREKLLERLKKRAEGLKHVVIAFYPVDGPKAFKLNPKAEMTVYFYQRMKILENYTFAPDALQSVDVEKMTKRVRAGLK